MDVLSQQTWPPEETGLGAETAVPGDSSLPSLCVTQRPAGVESHLRNRLLDSSDFQNLLGSSRALPTRILTADDLGQGFNSLEYCKLQCVLV